MRILIAAFLLAISYAQTANSVATKTKAAKTHDVAVAANNQQLRRENAKLMERIETALGDNDGNDSDDDDKRANDSDDDEDIAVAASNQRLARENAKLVDEIEAALGGKDVAVAANNQELIRENAKLMERIEAALGDNDDIAVAASNQRLARENAKLVYEIEAALGGKEIQPRSPASLLKEKAVSGGSGIVDAVCPRDNADREEGMCDTDHERSGSTWCGYCKYGMTINRPFPYVNDWCCKKEERNGGNCKCHY